jgi:hypothetical protein
VCGRARFRRMTLKVCPAYFNPRRILWLTPFRQEATCLPAPTAAPTVTTRFRWSRGVTSRPVLPAATVSGTLCVAATASTIPTLTGGRDEKASLDCSCLARTKSLDGLATQTGRGRSLHLISPAVAQKLSGVPKRDGCLQGVLSELQLDHLEAVAALSVRASGATAIRCSPMPSSCSSARAIRPSRLNCANRGSP